MTNARPTLLAAAIATLAVLVQPAIAESEAIRPGVSLRDQAARSLEILGDLGPTREQVDTAAEVFDRLAERDPDNHRWTMGRGYVAFHRGDIAACYDLLKEASRDAPDDAEAQYRYGNSCFAKLPTVGILSKGSLASRGRKAYQRALEIDPDHADATFALARFYAEAPGLFGGSASKAEDLASRLEELDRPDRAGRVRAYLARDEGEWDRVAQLLDEATRLAPDGREAAAVIVEHAEMLLNKKEDPRAAIEAADRVDASAAYAYGRAQITAATALLELDRADEAVDRLERGIEAFPDDPDAWLLLGEACVEAGREPVAARVYRGLMDRFPSDERAEEARKRSRRL